MEEINIKNQIHRALSEIDDNYKTKYWDKLLTTGFGEIDDNMLGFEPGEIGLFYSGSVDNELVSTIALDILCNLIKQSKGVAVFTKHRKALSLVKKILAKISTIPVKHLIYGNLITDDWPCLSDALTKLSKLKIFESSVNVSNVTSLIMSYPPRVVDNIDCIFVDIAAFENNDKSIISCIKKLKELASSYGIVVLVFLYKPYPDVYPTDQYWSSSFSDFSDFDKLFLLKWQNRKESLVTVEIQRGALNQSALISLRYDAKHISLNPIL